MRKQGEMNDQFNQAGSSYTKGSKVVPTDSLWSVSDSRDIDTMNFVFCGFKSCCRQKEIEETDGPYGVIGRTDFEQKDTKFFSVQLRKSNIISGRRTPRSSIRNSQNSQGPCNHRLSNSAAAAIPPSTKRALPELPSAQRCSDQPILDENDNCFHRQSNSNQVSHLTDFPSEVINPTYESIDAESDSISDPLYSKLDSEHRGQRKYDYPIFSNTVQPVYQSVSQVYTLASEDPYSSITSHVGDTTYDLGYARVNDSTSSSKMEPSSSKNIDQLYTQIRRNPDDIKLGRANSNVEAQPSVSSASVVYPSTSLQRHPETLINSEVTREPSYRYITVRESIDVIRQRLSQREAMQESLRNNMEQVYNGTPLVREHYYSSIGGGSDYESVPPNLYEPIRDTPENTEVLPSPADVKSVSSSLENPRPPLSPIPHSRSNVDDNLHIQSSPSSDMDRCLTVSASSEKLCGNPNEEEMSTSERVRRLRLRFFGEMYSEDENYENRTKSKADLNSNDPGEESCVYCETESKKASTAFNRGTVLESENRGCFQGSVLENQKICVNDGSNGDSAFEDVGKESINGSSVVHSTIKLKFRPVCAKDSEASELLPLSGPDDNPLLENNSIQKVDNRSLPDLFHASRKIVINNNGFAERMCTSQQDINDCALN